MYIYALVPNDLLTWEDAVIRHFLLTGDAENADPVCELSPQHSKIVEVLNRSAVTSAASKYLFREDHNSRILGGKT